MEDAPRPDRVGGGYRSNPSYSARSGSASSDNPLGARPSISGGFSEAGDGPPPGGLASAVSTRHIRRLPATRVLQLGQPIPGRGQILSRANAETVAGLAPSIPAAALARACMAKPGPVCRHTALGE